MKEYTINKIIKEMYSQVKIKIQTERSGENLTLKKRGKARGFTIVNNN